MKLTQCNDDLQLLVDGNNKCMRAGECTLRWKTLAEYSLQIQKADGSLSMVEPSGEPIYESTPNGWIWRFVYPELTAEVRYALEQDVLIKTVTVCAHQPLTIRYARTEIAAVAEELTRGGEGQPLFVGVNGFVSSTFPVAENHHDGAVLTLRHAPFVKLGTSQRFDFSPVVFGVNTKQANLEGLAESFRQFLLPRRPHPNNKLRVYCDWGAHDELAAEYELELNEAMSRRILSDLRRARETTGLTYDYYLMDDFWYAPETYQKFRATHWPEGPEKFLSELDEMGMQFGLWFDVNLQRVTDPNKKIFRGDSTKELCISAEENMDMVFSSVEKHIREERVRLLKFDFAFFECNNPGHDFHSQRHTASKDPAVRNFITHLNALRKEFPTLQVLAYNGFTTKLDYIGSVDPNRGGWAVSPFWALSIDYLYCGDPRPAERPAPMEKSIVHYSDCMLEQFMDALLPREAIDDHGSMIGLTNTIYYLQKRSVRDSYLMNIVRGTRKIHLYGETGLLDDADWTFLAKAQKLFDFVCDPACNTEPVLERPSRGTVYGYRNTNGDRGVITAVNVTAMTQPIVVDISGKLRWKRIYHAGEWCDENLALTGSLCTELEGYGIDAYAWERIGEEETETLAQPIAAQCPGGYVDMDAGTTVTIALPAECDRLGIRFMSDDLSPLRAANDERPAMRIAAQGGEITRLDTMTVWSGISFAVYKVRRTEDTMYLRLENSGEIPITLHWQMLAVRKEQ